MIKSRSTIKRIQAAKKISKALVKRSTHPFNYNKVDSHLKRRNG